jgi:hypothetical protein
MSRCQESELWQEGDRSFAPVHDGGWRPSLDNLTRDAGHFETMTRASIASYNGTVPVELPNRLGSAPVAT